MRRFVPFLLVLTLVASACKIRIDTSVSIDADESGTFAIEMSVDEEFRQFADEGGETGFDPADGLENLPSEWVVEPFTDGEFEGVRISTDFESLEELNERLAALTEVSEEGGGAPAELLRNLEVGRDGSTFTFRAEPEGLAGEPAADGSTFDDIDLAALFETLLEIRIIATLPGTITDHNADEVEGNRLIWLIDIDDEGSGLFATSSSGGGGLNTALIAVIALVGAVGIWLALARREAADSVLAESEALQPVD